MVGGITAKQSGWRVKLCFAERAEEAIANTGMNNTDSEGSESHNELNYVRISSVFSYIMQGIMQIYHVALIFITWNLNQSLCGVIISLKESYFKNIIRAWLFLLIMVRVSNIFNFCLRRHLLTVIRQSFLTCDLEECSSVSWKQW